MSNLELWDSVQETNPADTKAVSFGRKFTAIDAYSQIKKATDMFGAYGFGWGIKSIVHTFVPNTNLVMGEAQFFYKGFDIDGEFPVTSSILYISEKGKVDDEFAKKLETDMITKALSRLGFNADVFMGKFDDNRYVAEMNKKFKEDLIDNTVKPRQNYIDKAYVVYCKEVENEIYEESGDFKKVQQTNHYLTNDERIAVMDKFGKETVPNGKKMLKSVLKDLLNKKEEEK